MKRALLTVVCILLLSGCSGIKLFYKQLDWLVPRYLQGYTTLTDMQRTLLDRELAELRDWHCGTQLAGYADWIRALNADFQSGRISVTRLERRYDEFSAYWTEVMRQITPGFTELLRTASDAQIEELFVNLERKNDKYRKKHVGLSAPKRHKAHAREMERYLKRWLGGLTRAQGDRVADWSRRLTPISRDRLAMRYRWQAQLRRLLQMRSDSARFREGVHALLVTPEHSWNEAYRRKYTRNRRLTLELLAAIGRSLNPSQRDHLARRTQAWARDIEQLMCSGRQDDSV